MPPTTSELLEKFDSDVIIPTQQDKAYKKIRKTRSIYTDQLICLFAVAAMAVWRCGWRALVLLSISVLCCVIADIVCCRLSKKVYNPKDLSTITTGFCLVFLMPATIDYPTVIFAALMAIGIKHIFGGKDNYIFNPTAVTIAFLIICFPSKILQYPNVGELLPLTSEVTLPLQPGIESYLMKNGTAQALAPLDILLGNFVGAMGTTHVLVLLVCAVCMIFRRALSPIITVSAALVCSFISLLFPIYENASETMILELTGSYLLFGLIFLANDPQTVPKSWLGKLIYGITLGGLIMLFRYFGKVEGSFLFALLVANVLALHIDRFAEHIVNGLRQAKQFAIKSRKSFEQMREEGKKGSAPKLSDTQEIIVPATNYNMPPIDNKVSKINRKKIGIGADIMTFFGTIIKTVGAFFTSLFSRKDKSESVASTTKPEKTTSTVNKPVKNDTPETPKIAEATKPAKVPYKPRNNRAKKPAQDKIISSIPTESVQPVETEKTAETPTETIEASEIAEATKPAKAPYKPLNNRAKKPAQDKAILSIPTESVQPVETEKIAETSTETIEASEIAEATKPAKAPYKPRNNRAKKSAQDKIISSIPTESVQPVETEKIAETPTETTDTPKVEKEIKSTKAPEKKSEKTDKKSDLTKNALEKESGKTKVSSSDKLSDKSDSTKTNNSADNKKKNNKTKSEKTSTESAGIPAKKPDTAKKTPASSEKGKKKPADGKENNGKKGNQ